MTELIYNGQSLTLSRIEDGFVELRLQRGDAPINKLDRRTLEELEAVAGLLEGAAGEYRGLLVCSGLEVFVVGADINEFGALFARSEAEIVAHTWQANQLFERLAALPLPSVVAINGFALGGGLELALAFDYRVMAEGARIGLPEVSLGLIPGYGGTVRLPRVSSVELALQWIVDGKPRQATAAVEAGVVEQRVERAELRSAALELLRRAADGGLDWQGRRQLRLQAPMQPAGSEDFARLRNDLARGAAKHQPARAWLVDLLEAAQGVDHLSALRLEGKPSAGWPRPRPPPPWCAPSSTTRRSRRSARPRSARRCRSARRWCWAPASWVVASPIPARCTALRCG